jgi:hypothetical protein
VLGNVIIAFSNTNILFKFLLQAVKEQHLGDCNHVRLAIEIVRYLERKGLNVNMVLAAYFLSKLGVLLPMSWLSGTCL